VLAWQLEGLTQEEIREEVQKRGLTEYPEVALLSALAAAGANPETIRALRQTKAPRKIWKLGLRLPSPTDYLYEIAGAILWNDRESALLTIQNEADKQPRNPNVHLIYAHLASIQEDWIQAYGEATAAVKLVPDSPYAHGLRSTVCYHAQLSACAAREAGIFVKLRPEDAGAYILLGHALEMQANFAESLQAYREAKRLHAGYSAIYEGMGRVYGQMGEFEKAVQAFEQAIRMEENAPEYSCELAQLYLAEGYTRKAIDTLMKAKTRDPDCLKVLLALGNAYLAAERYPAAIQEYQELLKKAPDLEIAGAQLAKALRAEGRAEEAAQVFRDPPG
jgi:tetratricopeptide (TPR) repeat protein